MEPTDGHHGATRRRGAALEAALLEAAWEELDAVGYTQFTMEGVATRARTGKQVLYRRWPNRAQLVAAATRHALGPLFAEIPDTGELRGDVLAVLRKMVERARRVKPEHLRGMIVEILDLHPDFFDVAAGVMAEVLKRAVERGELVNADLNPRVVALPVDLLRYEGMRGQWPRSEDVPGDRLDALVVEIVDEVFLPLVRAVAGKPPAVGGR